MKKIILLVLALILSNLTFAQDTISQTEEEKSQYIQLMNYAPKGLDQDLNKRPNNNFLKEDLNSVFKIKSFYENQEVFEFTDTEINWLENRINEIAVAFYLEDKPVLIENVGGYGGCPNKMVITKNENENELTILRFCYGCTDYSQESAKFIEIFNNRTKLLLENANNTQ